ncbi:hypothetical protein [Actinomadura montaniterrae]|nr:hypothetical protein [Actinomadura montaniterrae]
MLDQQRVPEGGDVTADENGDRMRFPGQGLAQLVLGRLEKVRDRAALPGE